jgi:predicted dehydrogenase
MKQKRNPSHMIRLAIVGTGHIARRHLEHFLEHPEEVVVTAVVDIAPENAQWVIDATGATYYPTVEDALPHIDAALVSTPPNLRVEIIRSLAAGGKAVLCEKPMAGTVEDAREIARIVRDSGIPFMVGFMRRWHAPYADLKALVDSGELGRPLQFFRRRIGQVLPPEGNWRTSPEQLTGIAVESVSHDIDLLRWLAGDVAFVSGEVVESRADLPGYDDVVLATLRFENGAIGLIQVSWSSFVNENAVGVFGTDASAVIDGPGMWTSARLRVGNAEAQDVEKRRYPEADADEYGNAGQTAVFLALARGEDVAHPGVDDGLATVEISHQILDSSHGR